MAVYKDNATGTWRVIYRFTNWKGERKQTQKRGFATKREAQAWEHEAMLKQGAKLDMMFASFFEVYEADKKQRVKESTWESKSHVIRTKILPYFGNRKIAEIEAKDIIAWQNELMAYRDEMCIRDRGRLLGHKDQGQGPGQQQGGCRQYHAHDGNDAQALPQQPPQLRPVPGAVVIAHDGGAAHGLSLIHISVILPFLNLTIFV